MEPVWIIFLLAFVKSSEQGPPEAKTTQGVVKGKIAKSDFEFEYDSYYNIPYAKPPVGDLRFKDPVPADPWDGVLDGSKTPIICAQYDCLVLETHMGQEDCLVLHVHTPKGASTRNESLPVMFWVHGGAFLSGSANKDLYGPDYLLQKNVIFVGTNYRLGPLGFLSLNSSDVPGNAGMKDQVMALRWVQKNIKAFGGDPNRVTIFGQSAGAIAVNHLIASPITKGLFHGAILQSGSSFLFWGIQRENADILKKLTTNLNIKTDNPDEILKELRNVETKTLLDAIPCNIKIFPFYVPFVPVVEVEYPGVEAFLTKHPRDIIQSGDYQKIPIISGFNDNEGLLLVYEYLKLEQKKNLTDKDMVADFSPMLEDDLRAKLDAAKIQEIVTAARNMYFPADSKEELFQQYSNFMGDYLVVDGIYQGHHVMMQHQPVYCYKFGFNGERNTFKLLMQWNYKGAGHFDEIGYIFDVLFFEHDLITERERVVMDTFMELWTDFAKTGKPTPKYGWTAWNKDDQRCLQIGENAGMVQAEEAFPKTVKYWTDLRRQYGTSYF